MNECIFCKIINNEIGSKKIYEDDHVIAILDAFPLTKGHTLVIPKIHTKNIVTADNEILSHMIKVVKELSIEIKKTVDSDGITVFENEGLLQEVPHMHFHILPTYKDNRGIIFEKSEKEINLEEVKKIFDKR